MNASDDLIRELEALREFRREVETMDVIDLNDDLQGSIAWGEANKHWRTLRDAALSRLDEKLNT